MRLLSSFLSDDNMRLFELTDPEFKAVATVAKALAEVCSRVPVDCGGLGNTWGH